jgi:exosortase/archaeosortase family protein
MSLPIMPSLNFFLSYPIRLFSSSIALRLILLTGTPVELTGLFFEFDGKLVMVDAPCSGLNSIWSGVVFSCALAAFLRINLAGTLVLGISSGALLIASNILRTASLFFLEAGIIPAPPGAHTACGIFTFAMTLPPIAGVAFWIGKHSTPRRRIRPPTESSEREAGAASNLLGCILGVLLMTVGGNSTYYTSGGPPAGTPKAWPSTFEGRPLTRLPLEARELRFATTFPGQIARFTDGEREIVIRQISEVSRKLHPSAECFAANGYVMKPLPGKLSALQTWSCFTASKDGERLSVCESIRSASGESWSDVSSWYWSNFLESSSGPWTAYTIASRVP